MILHANITEKSFGPKTLFSHLDFSIDDGEKVGVIGRNGIGKSTLFAILAGHDPDFTGDIARRRGTTMVATSQEYHDVGDKTVVQYILAGLPKYAELSEILHKFSEITNPTRKQLEAYSNALDEFTAKNYYYIDDQVREQLKNFQLGETADRAFATLSGGQKRLSEVIKIMHSGAHLALIDEPTNFMDYVAKQQFIDWMSAAPEAILVVTHDRDVLAHVDRIIEIKDGGATAYKGNYQHYLRENASRTSSAMTDYEVMERRKTNLRQKVIEFQRLKEKARSPGTIQQFKRLENNARLELADLEAKERPSFWVDRDSVGQMNYKDSDRYEKYKAKNVKLGVKTSDTKSRKTLIGATSLSVGYTTPLFANINFELHEGESLEIRGRNGVGKTTLVKALLGSAGPQIFAGETYIDRHIRLGIYEQEVNTKYFNLTVPDAITAIHDDQHANVNDRRVRQLMSDYLFEESDRSVLVRDLSGGQKARLQIIAMLAGDPNLLVLDEPTSHLDLPSIEELEHALRRYHGAILYISHDNYFRQKLPAQTIEL